jgi:ribonuclease HII
LPLASYLHSRHGASQVRKSLPYTNGKEALANFQVTLSAQPCYDAATMAGGPRPLPTTVYEEAHWASGCFHVAGVDEVGRGPLAGPVYAAAVILKHDVIPEWLLEVRDSKEMVAPDRERLSEVIRDEALAYGIGWASVAEIDGWGITTANYVAMMRALQQLPVRPRYVLIDGPRKLPAYLGPQQAIVDGDALCSSIAAASIIAKVARDSVMCDLDRTHPEYGFASHKGYATKDHLEALAKHGPSVHHRRSWGAVRRRGGLEPAETPELATR